MNKDPMSHHGFEVESRGIKKQRLLVFVSCATCYTVANLTWWVQPILIEQLISARQFSASAAGFIVSFEMGAMALASFLASKLLKRGRFWNMATVGLAAAIAGSLLSLFASSVLPLVLARALAGTGEGLCFMVANTAIVYLRDRDRAYGNMTVVSILVGVAAVAVVPLVPTERYISGFVVLLGFLIALIPCILVMPKVASLHPADEVMVRRTGIPDPLTSDTKRRIRMLAAATFIVALGSGLMWSFYAVIGVRAGLSEAAASEVIAFSILGALGGSVLVTVLGNTFGRVIPITSGLVVLTAAIMVLSFHPGVWGFRAGTMVNVAAMYFTMPFLFACGSAQEATGRGAVVVGSAFLLTGALGPYLGGVLVDSVGIEFVGIGEGVIAVIAWLLIVYVDRHTPKQSHEAAHISVTAIQ
jgi:predicted MFS family arabinose efflux permease